MKIRNLMADERRIVLPRYIQWLAQNGDAALVPNDGRDGIGAMILQQMLATPRDRTGSFSASSAGGCPRAQVFGYHGGEADPPGPGLQAIFEDGKWRHLRWQAVLLQAQILTDIEFPLMWKAKQQRGTMDGLGVVPADHPVPEWQNLEFGFELKGVNAFQYGSYVKGGVKVDHLNQVARYFLLSGLELFSIVYENKSTQETHEWVISRNDPGMAERIEAQSEEVELLLHHAEADTLPPQLPLCSQGKGAWKSCNFGGTGGVCAFASTVADITIHRERP